MNQIKAIIGTHRLCRTKAFRIRVPVGFRSKWVIPTVKLADTYEAKIEDIEDEASSEEIPCESDTEHQTDTEPETDQGLGGEEYEHDESEVNEDELRETERQEQSLREQIAKLELDKMRTKRIRKKKE